MGNIEAETGPRAVDFWIDELESCQSPDLVVSRALVQLKGPPGNTEFYKYHCRGAGSL